jgi:hypothetical protein
MNQLTHQEQKIVALVTQGLTNKQVAQRIGTIASYAIDLEQGRIAYAVLSVGTSWDLAISGLPFPGMHRNSLPMTGSSSSMV